MFSASPLFMIFRMIITGSISMAENNDQSRSGQAATKEDKQHNNGRSSEAKRHSDFDTIIIARGHQQGRSEDQYNEGGRDRTQFRTDSDYHYGLNANSDDNQEDERDKNVQPPPKTGKQGKSGRQGGGEDEAEEKGASESRSRTGGIRDGDDVSD
jgi:hypothetical protein